MPVIKTADARTVRLVPPITPEELARRNAATIAFLDDLANDAESEEDQRETWKVLSLAFGAERVDSKRPAIRP